MVGAGCSPNTMTRCEDFLIGTNNLNRIVEITKNTVTAQSGVTFKALNEALAKESLALSQLTSISEQTVGGALACAIHGTGADIPCISEFVEWFEIVTPKGEVLRCSRSERADLFKAGLCHLGGLGCITQACFKVEPAFKLRAIQSPQVLENTLENISQKIKSADHWRLWWFPHTDKCIEWGASKVEADSENVSRGDWVANQIIVFNYCLELLYYIGKFIPCVIPLVNQSVQYIAFNSDAEQVDQSYNVFNFDCLFR
eukprot:GHVL01006777.1.p1 GENE.GHVL01006777.1~~GHVL01006777.1.p1  ORF type:complete len:257 (+),score=37.24 GHVL01006777.1:384-1154(+)